jgi:ribose-phosphate pyrophosphokinase
MAITFTTKIGPGFTTTPTFESMYFPAGEPHVKVANENTGKGELIEIAYLTGADANELVLLGMWANACHERGARTVALIPYLPGARADRGLPFGAKVYADIINGFTLDQVICFDPHSPVMPGLIRNLTVVDSAALIRHAIVGRADTDEHAQTYAGIIAPDKGAVARAQRVADACHLPLYKAEKHRDEATGKLSGFTCEALPEGGKFLVFDDICDGGGTFIGLAEATGLDRQQLGLYVSHGVFSGQALHLWEFFADIYTTDSFPPRTSNMNATIIPLHHTLTGAIK